MKTATDPELPRLMAKIRKETNGCWMWTGFRHPVGGHGQAFYRGRLMHAHRAIYMATHGLALDSKTCVCHRCDNPPCCNPEHMFLGTHRDNMLDMCAKGRHLSVTKPWAYARGSRSHLSKLSEEQVLEIRSLLNNGVRPVDIYRTGRFPISAGGIRKIKNNKSRKIFTCTYQDSSKANS